MFSKKYCADLNWISMPAYLDIATSEFPKIRFWVRGKECYTAFRNFLWTCEHTRKKLFLLPNIARWNFLRMKGQKWNCCNSWKVFSVEHWSLLRLVRLVQTSSQPLILTNFLLNHFFLVIVICYFSHCMIYKPKSEIGKINYLQLKNICAMFGPSYSWIINM